MESLWLIYGCLQNNPSLKPEYLYEPIFFKEDDNVKTYNMQMYSRNCFDSIILELSEDYELTCKEHYKNINLPLPDRAGFLLKLLGSKLSKEYYSVIMAILCHDNYLFRYDVNYTRTIDNSLNIKLDIKILCECGRNIIKMQDRNGLKYEIINEVYKILPMELTLIVYSYYERESYKQIITELLFRKCFPNNLIICNIIYEYSKSFTNTNIKIIEVIESVI